eukprot:UN27125
MGGSDDDEDQNVRKVGGSRSSKRKNKDKGRKGMSLTMPGKKGNANNDLAAMMEQEKDLYGSQMTKTSPQQESDDYSSTEPVKVKIQEKCVVECDRDGTMKKFQVEGVINLTVMNPDFAKIDVNIERDGIDGKFRPHPKLDKKAWKNQKQYRGKIRKRLPRWLEQ